MDGRKTCTQCLHYQRGKCMNAKAAQLGVWASIEIGAALANQPQHCPAHAPRARAFETPTETTA